jgi:hypothetical protein
MTDQKNKQQQPSQDHNDPNRDQQGKNQHDMGKDKDTQNKSANKQQGSDADDDADTKPGKSTEIGDNPEETKKKIPNMHK